VSQRGFGWLEGLVHVLPSGQGLVLVVGACCVAELCGRADSRHMRCTMEVRTAGIAGRCHLGPLLVLVGAVKRTV
jgi:hypothetical protein